MNLTLLVVLALAAYRLTRLITTDDLPPIYRAREWLKHRWGTPNGREWFDGITCGWCVGSIISFALVAGVAYLIPMRLPAIQALAVATVVGLIGGHDG